VTADSTKIESPGASTGRDLLHGRALSPASRRRVEETVVVKPLAIHHVAINVRDLDEALEFYEGALGFVRRHDRPEFGFPGAWLDVGDQQLHLIEAPAPADVGQHFAVRVDDLGVVVAELRDRGHQPSDPSPVANSRQAFINDPSGNVIELHEIG
jgi:glyoxylase I family protein